MKIYEKYQFRGEFASYFQKAESDIFFERYMGNTGIDECLISFLEHI